MGGRSWIGDPPSHPGLRGPGLFNPNQGFMPENLDRTPWPYGEPDPEPMPIRQRRSRWRWLLRHYPLTVAVVILILAGLIGSWGISVTQQPPAVPVPAIGSPDLAIFTRYTVEGTGRADITYRTLEGDETAVNAALPWSLELDTIEPVLTAHHRSDDVTTITCRVEQYGSAVKVATGKGTHATCTAIGPVG